MRGIGLIFTADGARFQFDRPLNGFVATVQNALVNLGTKRGSDPWFPLRGTKLQQDGAQGRMINPAWAQQSADFASLHTTAFVRASGGSPALQRLSLTVMQLAEQRVTFRVAAESETGETVRSMATL